MNHGSPALFIAGGFVVVFLVVALPRLRDRYEEGYENERAFFHHQRPRMWGIVEGIVDDDEAVEGELEPAPGRCPVCGTENEAQYTYCRSCGSRIPTLAADRTERSDEPKRGEYENEKPPRMNRCPDCCRVFEEERELEEHRRKYHDKGDPTDT